MGWIVKVHSPHILEPLYVTRVTQNSKTFGRKKDAKVYQRKESALAAAKAVNNTNGWECEALRLEQYYIETHSRN